MLTKLIFLSIPLLLLGEEPKVPVKAPVISEAHKKEWYKADAAVAKAALAKTQSEIAIVQDCGVDYTPVFSNDEMVCQLKPKAVAPSTEKDAKY